MNSAIALDGISWENAFNQAFKLIPKPHISYHFRFLFNGDIIYDGKKEEYGDGFANINDVVIWEDKRFDRLQEANLYYTTTNTALSPEAAMNNLENYQQKVDEIMSEPPDFQLLKNTNLKLGIVDEPMAKEFAQYFSKYKHTATLSLLSKPESDYFYGGINFLEVDGYLNLIDGASAVAGIFGADIIFDGIGAYYAYENKRYVEAAFYTAAIAIPFMNGATRKALMDGSAYLLKTLNGKYVVVPRNVLGMNYMFRVEQAFSQFSRTALNVKSFNRAARYKTSKQFVSALEEGLLARADNIKRINENPTFVDGFYNYHTAGKGSLDNFLQESDEVIRIFSNFKRLKDLPENVLARVKNWDDDVLKQLDDDLADQVFRQSLDEELVDAWDNLRKNGRTELKLDIPSLEALNKIRKNPKLSELGLTDDMLGKIQGIDNVSYVQMLDEVEKAMDALPAGKTKNFSKIIQNGEKRGLVNTDPTNGIYDRRHSWLTLKVIQDNSEFLKQADVIEFEVVLETIDDIPQSVPDIKLTITEEGFTKVKIGEVYAGTAGAKTNMASQSLTYFNAVSDIRDLRFFRRMNVADKTVAKTAVIDAWKKGGVTRDQ